MEHIRIELKRSATEISVLDLCDRIWKSYRRMTPAGSGPEYLRSYLEYVDSETIREGEIRASIIAELSAISGHEVSQSDFLSFDILAEFAYKRDIEVMQVSPVAGRTSLYTRALCEYLDKLDNERLKNKPKSTNVPPPLREAQWQDEILTVIRELGHNPIDLPRYKNGENTVKKIVEKLVMERNPAITPSSFKKAWEQLAKRKEIVHLSR